MVDARVVHQVRIDRHDLLERLLLLLDEARAVRNDGVAALERQRVDHRPVPPILPLGLDGNRLRDVLRRQIQDKPPLLRQPVPFEVQAFHSKPPLRLLDQRNDAAGRVVGRRGVGQAALVVGQPGDLLHHRLQAVVFEEGLLVDFRHTVNPHGLLDARAHREVVDGVWAVVEVALGAAGHNVVSNPLGREHRLRQIVEAEVGVQR